MQTKTVCCKLVSIPEIEVALQDTSEKFSMACNFVLKKSEEHQTSNAIKLHQICYKEIRVLFGLPANLACQSIRRVVACLIKLKGSRKRAKEFRVGSISYDARVFSYREKDEIISLSTVKGRVRVSLMLGEYQRKHLKGKTPKSCTVIKKGKQWFAHICIECDPCSNQGKAILGVDLGINNIAALSTGTIFKDLSRKEFKKKRARVRASIQSKGKKGCKKLLKRLSGYENRRIKYENHVISKKIVEEAKRHDCGTIRMEQLKAIRQKTRTWNKHRNRMMAGWSFYQLQQFVVYKAAAIGIFVEFVNPAYTSQTCHKCLKLGSRSGDLFTCLTCGEEHADVNASRVIAIGGAACKPARISSRQG